MSETKTTARWEIHRYPNSVYGPQGISYYSLKISATEYLSVQKSEYGAADGWTWKRHTISAHDAFGGARVLARGTARTQAAAKAQALQNNI